MRFSRQVSVSAVIMLSACNTAILLLDAFYAHDVAGF
jgi:hypothetical protein